MAGVEIPKQVERWCVAEIAVRGPLTGNPFEHQALRATFSHGFMRPQYRDVKLPDTDFTLDVIDTWSMTIERLEGTHRGVTRVPLGGRQYMAIRARVASWQRGEG